MAVAGTTRRYTPAEYLALERQAEVRHEYFNGEIFAMAGATREHNLIMLSIGSELRRLLRGSGCEVYTTDMRVQVRATGLYTYPDVTVVCGQRQFGDDSRDILLNPTVLFEVLSHSTEAYDRGDKFAHYRRLPSLQCYVLVAQDKVRVERYTRSGDLWVLAEFSDLEAMLSLDALSCALPLSEIYEGVEFPDADALGQVQKGSA